VRRKTARRRVREIWRHGRGIDRVRARVGGQGGEKGAYLSHGKTAEEGGGRGRRERKEEGV
jgi:hypothetical protein